MKKLLGVAVDRASRCSTCSPSRKPRPTSCKSAVVLVGDAFNAIIAFLTALFS